MTGTPSQSVSPEPGFSWTFLIAQGLGKCHAHEQGVDILIPETTWRDGRLHPFAGHER